MARYIDADKLKEKKYYDEQRHEYCVSIAEVDWQPTADVQEVKHGKWKFRDGVSRCSVCGDYVSCGSIYCPNCGAKMDKE